jgi:hypothetical protein
MFTSARWIPRLACGMVLLACADSTDPTAPSVAASAGPPQLSAEGGDAEPTPEELAEMPAEFRMPATLLSYWTDVGFTYDGTAYAQGFMRYFATNATQEVTLDLRFENRMVATRKAYGEQSDFLPAIRTLWTSAHLGVSGSCGHLADGATIHKAWHQFLVGGWRFLSWGNAAGTSGDSAEQPACAPPPPPPPPADGVGRGGEYEEGCTLCTQWLSYSYGHVVGIWWECEEIDGATCQALMT